MSWKLVAILILSAIVILPVEASTQCGTGKWFFDNTHSTSPVGYETLSEYPINATEVTENVTLINSLGWVLIDSYISPVGEPGITKMLSGLRRARTYNYVSGASGTTQLNLTEFVRLQNGNEIKLISMESEDINDLVVTEQLFGAALTTNKTMNVTDRIVIKVYGKTTHSAPIQLYWTYQGSKYPSHMETGLYACPPIEAMLSSSGNEALGAAMGLLGGLIGGILIVRRSMK